METVIPAFRPDGAMVRLSEVLAAVGDVPWAWRMLAFEGTGRPGSTVDLNRLNRDIEAADDDGVAFTTAALRRFADQVDQAVNCTLQAYRAGTTPRRVLEIEALDSTEWIVWADDDDQAAVDAATRIGHLLDPGR
jgi:hypothetical protein